MTNYEFKFDDRYSLEVLVESLEEKAKEDRDQLQGVIKKVGQEIIKDSKRYLEQNGNIDTKKLYGSIKGRYAMLGAKGHNYLVKASAKHAIYIEEGTRPHIIKAKNAKALRFFSGDKPVFVKQVNHPGTKASPFMEPALSDNIPDFVRGIEEVIGRWM